MSSEFFISGVVQVVACPEVVAVVDNFNSYAEEVDEDYFEEVKARYKVESDGTAFVKFEGTEIMTDTKAHCLRKAALALWKYVVEPSVVECNLESDFYGFLYIGPPEHEEKTINDIAVEEFRNILKYLTDEGKAEVREILEEQP